MIRPHRVQTYRSVHPLPIVGSISLPLSSQGKKPSLNVVLPQMQRQASGSVLGAVMNSIAREKRLIANVTTVLAGKHNASGSSDRKRFRVNVKNASLVLSAFYHYTRT